MSTAARRSPARPTSGLHAASVSSHDAQMEEDERLAIQMSLQMNDNHLDEQSLAQARRMAMEEEEQVRQFQQLQETYKYFECGVCSDEYEDGDGARAHGCEHVVCRGCMLGQVNAQVEQRHWPVFCPLCPADAASRGGEYRVP